MPINHSLQCQISPQHKRRLDQLCDKKVRIQGYVIEKLIDFAYDAKFNPTPLGKTSIKRKR